MSRNVSQLALALILTISSTAWAGHINGQVRYQNGVVADRVVVRLRSDVIAFQTEVQTDPQGRFTFDGLPLTTFHLIIEGQGFRTYESHIDISVSKMSYELITLHPNKEPEAKPVPPEGPSGVLNARIAQIPPEARHEFEAGKRTMKVHDSAASIGHFQKAIALYAPYAEAYQLLGVVHLETGRLREAEQELLKSVEIEPNLSTGHFALGICRNSMAKYAEAEASLLRGLELDPLAANGHYELGRTYWAIGRWQEAGIQAEKAISLNPNLATAHVLLGDVGLRKRDPQAALKEYKEALRLDPKGPMAAATQQIVSKIEQASTRPQ